MIVAEARSPAGIQGRHFFPQARADAELDGVTLAVIEPDRFNARNRSSAQARHTVESCPPENRTRAVSEFMALPYTICRCSC
jgi:hypothetical protein